MYRTILSLVLCLVAANAASAEIIAVPGGAAAPPTMLGSYTMTPFPLDDRPIFDVVDTIPSPLGGELVSSIPLSHRQIGVGWAGWGHGYMGDVYDSLGETEIILTLPPDRYAFYLSGSHDHGASYNVYAHADDSATVTQLTQSYSSANIGFYQDDPSAGPIGTVTISCDTNFAIGEFGIAVPEPVSLTLLATGVLALVRRRR